MAKKNKQTKPAPVAVKDTPATLKDLLNPDVLEKLKAQADALKQDEVNRKLEQRKAEEDARKAEQKRRDNDFEYLLENTKMDWKKFK
ncbi:hypothetical protein BVG16_01725 [Paenibacillus selenitireducens]|uniref:DUF3886 domain-containing protein n=1 Tax=Paenibacillus selenitireducens TaxID=1324314 RepID=A0A1T2XN16_9BACL|nr:YqkE family protein [Paenibacillus selenitireducens]OPA81083.1 hypothetical protein BVG16_01725 [Paenibacillus selenitireducens]